MITFFRQNILPILILIVFVFALVVVSARGFISSDMLEPAYEDNLAVPNDNLDVPESLYTDQPLEKDIPI